MHKFHCIILIFFVSLNSKAQNSKEDLISRYRPGTMWFFTGFRPAKAEKVTKYDRLMFDLTYNSWNGRDRKPFDNNWTSIGFNTSLMFDIPLTKGNTISLGTGLTHSLFRIQHDNLLKVDPTNTFTNDTLTGSMQMHILHMHETFDTLNRVWRKVPTYYGPLFALWIPNKHVWETSTNITKLSEFYAHPSSIASTFDCKNSSKYTIVANDFYV